MTRITRREYFDLLPVIRKAVKRTKRGFWMWF